MQAHVARCLHRSAHVAHVALLEVVAGVADVVFLLGHLDGAEVQVAAGDDGGLAVLAGVDDLGGHQVDVAPGAGHQGAAGGGDVETSNAVDVGPRKVAQPGLLGVAVGGGGDVEVAPGTDRQGLAGIEGATDVVDVGTSLERHSVAGDAPAEVAQVFAGELHRGAPGDGAGVDQVSLEVEVDAVGADEGAIAIQVALLDPHIYLRDHRAGGGAVGQGHVALHQPDDVAGELGHLLGAEGDAGAQVPGLGVGAAGVKQGVVLRLVAAVAV
ncbi:hypothetical protein FQZ97_362220 [compost metagenome]